MNDKTEGGAGPIVAAHSKDGSAPGPAPASSATGNEDRDAGGVAETVSGLPGQVRNTAGRAASSVSDAVGSASKSLSEQGARVADEVANLVREQPIVALLATGAACLVLGVLLGRR